MNKEELQSKGWEFLYSGPSPIKAWGEYLIHLRHPSGRMVSGYGLNEVDAVSNASITIEARKCNS